MNNMLLKPMISFLFFFVCAMNCALGNSILAERLNHVVQPPQFTTPPQIHRASDEIVYMASPILKNRLKTMNYDRIFPVIQFVEHFEKTQQSHPKITPIEALKNFDFTPLSETDRGGPCVSLALDLQKSLPKELKSYICLAKLPKKFQQFALPEYSHAAVMIKFCTNEESGYVLLDPSFDIDEPIVIKGQGSPSYYQTKKHGCWKFYLKDDSILCEMVDAHGDQMIYKTCVVTNVVACSAVPMLIADRRLSLLSREDDGTHIAHINVELNKKRIIWDKGEIQYSPIHFSHVLQGQALPNWFCEQLFISQNRLMHRINKIIKYNQTLNSLYIDYLKLIQESQDFSITGPLENGAIDATIKQLL